MTATEFRDKKTREIQELFEKLSSLEGSSLSPEMKDRLFRTYQRQIERLTAVLDNPALRQGLIETAKAWLELADKIEQAEALEAQAKGK